MALTKILNLQCILFTLIGLGIFANKRGIIKSNNKEVLTDLLIYIFLPCNIISSFNMKFTLEIFIKFTIILLFATLTQIGCMVLSKVLYKNVSIRKRRVLEYATICSNAAFLGLPIVAEIFGPTGVMYASIAMLPQRVVMWSSGISCFTKSDGFWKIFKRVVFHPCIVAVYIGILLMFLPFDLPQPVVYTIKTIGNCTLTISMLLIGTMLGELKSFSTVISTLTIKYSLVRLLIIPLISFLICKIGQLDHLSSGVIALLSGMPAGSTTAILAAKYNSDYLFASELIIFSTLSSIVTIPLLTMIFEFFK